MPFKLKVRTTALPLTHSEAIVQCNHLIHTTIHLKEILTIGVYQVARPPTHFRPTCQVQALSLDEGPDLVLIMAKAEDTVPGPDLVLGAALTITWEEAEGAGSELVVVQVLSRVVHAMLFQQSLDLICITRNL